MSVEVRKLERMYDEVEIKERRGNRTHNSATVTHMSPWGHFCSNHHSVVLNLGRRSFIVLVCRQESVRDS